MAKRKWLRAASKISAPKRDMAFEFKKEHKEFYNESLAGSEMKVKTRESCVSMIYLVVKQ